jgi:hypothetical protein
MGVCNFNDIKQEANEYSIDMPLAHLPPENAFS